MWEGRGATARRREAKWSSGVAAVFWVYYNKHVFKDSLDITRHHYHYYYRGALYNTKYAFVLSPVPSPAISGIVPRIFCCTSVVLLWLLYYSEYYRTHCGFVGCCWVFFFCCAVLYYLCTTVRTAVLLLLYVVAGRIGSWVCPWVRAFFSFCIFPPAIPAPRWHTSAYHY